MEICHDFLRHRSLLLPISVCIFCFQHRKASYEAFEALNRAYSEGEINKIRRNHEIKDIERRLKKDKLAAEYYDLKQEVRHNPSDLSLRFKCALADFKMNWKIYTYFGLYTASTIAFSTKSHKKSKILAHLNIPKHTV